MRDTTPGGVRSAANRNEIRMRESDRSARRTGDLAAAAARGCIAYAERTSGNVTLAAGTEAAVIPGIIVPVEPGRQYRIEARALIWQNGTSAVTHGSLLVRMLLSAEGEAADLSSPVLDSDRVTIVPGGFGVGARPARTVPPIDTDQTPYLSVAVSAVVAGAAGGCHAVAAAPARVWVFDDGAAVLNADAATA